MSDNTRTLVSVDSPVRMVPADVAAAGPSPGIALCLSGGGYRAMVFHLGTLIRLNELGLLPKLQRVSSVSGGSITAGYLGLKWSSLQFDAQGVATNLVTEVISPIRKVASTTIDAGSVIGGALLPGSISDWVARQYKDLLFGDATLQDLPSDTSGPRFVINATNVQSGVLWRFSRPFMGDYLVGLVANPTVSLAHAVAASSAFPPVLSPAVFEVDPSLFKPDPQYPLGKPPFTSRIVLCDGGVYDNLGIETAWKRCATVLVSDAGAKIEAEPEPKEDWARHAIRVMDLVDNQVRCLRKRQIISAFADPQSGHDGTYWGIRTDIEDYGMADTLPCPHDRTMQLAAIPTRLKAMDSTLQERLMNWSYAVCDAALRRHAVKYLPAENTPPTFPFPASQI